MLRHHPLPWVFSIWTVLIGALILPNLLDAPHYRYLLTIPGGVYGLGAMYVALGVLMFGTLIARRDGVFKGLLGAMGMLCVLVAVLLFVAALTVPNSVNMGPLTWGGMGAVAIVYALGEDNGTKVG